MGFRSVPNLVTLNGEMALILPNLVISDAYCIEVVDKAITMDNILLLSMSSSKRLQRDRATPTA